MRKCHFLVYGRLKMKDSGLSYELVNFRLGMSRPCKRLAGTQVMLISAHANGDVIWLVARHIASLLCMLCHYFVHFSHA